MGSIQLQLVQRNKKIKKFTKSYLTHCLIKPIPTISLLYCFHESIHIHIIIIVIILIKINSIHDWVVTLFVWLLNFIPHKLFFSSLSFKFIKKFSILNYKFDKFNEHEYEFELEMNWDERIDDGDGGGRRRNKVHFEFFILFFMCIFFFSQHCYFI